MFHKMANIDISKTTPKTLRISSDQFRRQLVLAFQSPLSLQPLVFGGSLVLMDVYTATDSSIIWVLMYAILFFDIVGMILRRI